MTYTKENKLGNGILSSNGMHLVIIVGKCLAMTTNKIQ